MTSRIEEIIYHSRWRDVYQFQRRAIHQHQR